MLKLLITAYFAKNDSEMDQKAREASERLVKLAPEDVEAWIMKAEAYTRGKPKDAVSSYEKVAQAPRNTGEPAESNTRDVEQHGNHFQHLW